MVNKDKLDYNFRFTCSNRLYNNALYVIAPCKISPVLRVFIAGIVNGNIKDYVIRDWMKRDAQVKNPLLGHTFGLDRPISHKSAMCYRQSYKLSRKLVAPDALSLWIRVFLAALGNGFITLETLREWEDQDLSLINSSLRRPDIAIFLDGFNLD